MILVPAVAVRNIKSVVVNRSTHRPTLLSIVEQGGYPDLSKLYTQCGFEVTTVTSTRKALAHIKKNPPDVMVAEFIFSPTYGSQLSNFEGLLAGIQRDAPDVKLIALYDKKDEAHLLKVSERFAVYGQFTFPVDAQELEEILRSI